jgi:DNA-binding response OmpR family regulator
MENGGQTISRPRSTNGAEGQPSGTQEATGRKVILVIDDNLVFQKAMLIKLRSYGYDVMTAEDGSAALGAIVRVQPDLILLDINFPPDVGHGGGLGWDGFLILRWMRRSREGASIPVIAVTGGELDLYREHCKEAGILDLLPKPVDHELLVSRIRALLNQPQPETKPLLPPPPPVNFQPVRRILFVDDASDWHQMAIRKLTEQGFEVVATDTAEGAVSEAARIRPDVMILDLKLEKENGLRVMVLLLAAHPSVPLLVYAGLGLNQEGKSELMDLGVSQILQKRSMEELQDAVQSASEQPRQSVEVRQAKSESKSGTTAPEFDKILMVEDDPTLTDQLRGYLESESYYVTCVSNAAEALRQMASTDFDVILTDMVLPGHSGEDFYHEVERVTPELCRRFIFITGHDAERRTDDFIRRVRAFMLWKPVQLGDLLSAVQTVQRKDRLTRVLSRCRSVTTAV